MLIRTILRSAIAPPVNIKIRAAMVDHKRNNPRKRRIARRVINTGFYVPPLPATEAQRKLHDARELGVWDRQHLDHFTGSRICSIASPVGTSRQFGQSRLRFFSAFAASASTICFGE